jgi:hypothetical protein
MKESCWTSVRSVVFLALAVLGVAGCGRGVETKYGRSRSVSVNGTGVFADLFRAEGDQVRPAVRLTDELREWADVIVRFAPAPGPPPREEAEWYNRWLNEFPERRLVYVTRDYDATEEYWARALDQLPADATARTRERIEEARKEAEDSIDHPPPMPKKAADDWFTVKTSGSPTVCSKLAGPWARGMNLKKAALTRRQTFKAPAADVLLKGDGEPLVIAWTRPNDSEVLAVAGGEFLLNLPLTEPARWPLAERTVAWTDGRADSDAAYDRHPPRNVAFVEGASVMAGTVAEPSVFALLKVSPFGQVAAQLLVLGLAACLARAPRLGRARPEEASGADRPVAHPEALGALLERSGQAREARTILEAYRRWRNGPPGRGAASS